MTKYLYYQNLNKRILDSLIGKEIEIRVWMNYEAKTTVIQGIMVGYKIFALSQVILNILNSKGDIEEHEIYSHDEDKGNIHRTIREA